MGHALVALSQPEADAVHKVSIIPRGVGALGYTIQRPGEDRYLATRAELEDRIATLLGGRAAEQLVFGQVSTGAADDLAKATDIAREMVTRHGMDASVGPMAVEPPRALLDMAPDFVAPRAPVSEATQQRIDEAVGTILSRALEQAQRVLQRHRAVLDRGAAALLEKETLDESAMRELRAALTHPAAAPAEAAQA
jgi:cell division protease FtsH